MKNPSLQEATIVSFDIARGDRARRTAIHRLIHGRTETVVKNGIEKTYRYPGLLDQGGFRMGQSVFLFPPNLASHLLMKLKKPKVDHRSWKVWIAG
jgi:hypothetical protein